MRRIPLRNRQGGIVAHTLIDDADYERLKQWTWRLSGGGYAWRSRPPVYMHRLLLGLRTGDGKQGDHKDRNPLNNRRRNLRVATPGQNNQNTNGRSGRISRYRGVTWHKARRKWMAQARLDGTNHYLGYFDDEDDAGAAAADWRAEHHPFSSDAEKKADARARA